MQCFLPTYQQIFINKIFHLFFFFSHENSFFYLFCPLNKYWNLLAHFTQKQSFDCFVLFYIHIVPIQFNFSLFFAHKHMTFNLKARFIHSFSFNFCFSFDLLLFIGNCFTCTHNSSLFAIFFIQSTAIYKYLQIKIVIKKIKL